jgi:hypothetical protein
MYGTQFTQEKYDDLGNKSRLLLVSKNIHVKTDIYRRRRLLQPIPVVRAEQVAPLVKHFLRGILAEKSARKLKQKTKRGQARGP